MDENNIYLDEWEVRYLKRLIWRADERSGNAQTLYEKLLLLDD